MTFQEILFFVLAGLAVFSALMVVLQNNPVRSALFLVVVFIASSGLWLLAQAEFLALVLVLVYVGAVMTLFLFVVMMLDVEKMSGQRYLKRYLPIGLCVVALLTGLMWVVIQSEQFGHLTAGAAQTAHSNTQQLGLVLYTVYAYPFEIAAVLLLIAIISAIILAHRPPRAGRVQNINEQLVVQKADRLRIVKVPSHNPQEMRQL